MNFFQPLKPIILGTRGSALAKVQTNLVAQRLQTACPAIFLEQKIITTLGDTNLMMPIDQPVSEASGFFTHQLEEALLAGEIDAAVHSLKDLPVITPPGLRLAAILPRGSTQDLLITLEPGGLNALPSGSIIGTSSPRRTELLRQCRSDLHFVPLRGNVPTRLKKLANQHNQSLHGIVLARAGLERLGYENLFLMSTEATNNCVVPVLAPSTMNDTLSRCALSTPCSSLSSATLKTGSDLELATGEGFFIVDQSTFYVSELDTMLPAPGQGAIAVETRAELFSPEIERALKAIHDKTTALCVTTERLLLRYLGGGCHMALGALATIDEETQEIHLRATYTPFAGAPAREGEAIGATPEEAALLVATQLGEKLASVPA